MTQLHVEAEGTTSAAPDAVWALVADVESYCRWGPWSTTCYESKGDVSASGVGAVRRLKLGRTTVVERVEEADPARGGRHGDRRPPAVLHRQHAAMRGDRHADRRRRPGPLVG